MPFVLQDCSYNRRDMKKVVHAGCMNWAGLGPRHRNIIVLTSEKLSDLGNSATFYSVLVEVESAKPFP
jgi:hypothetical protein